MNIGFGLSLNSRASAFNPLSLYSAGELGDYGDASDLTRLWQNTTGTTPVTADGQSVARMDGARGVVSLRQSNASAQPTYKTSGGLSWLSADGGDSLLSAAALNLSTVGAVTVCVALRKESDAAQAHPIAFGSAGGAGTFNLTAPNAASASYAGRSVGSASVTATYTNAAVASPNLSVVTFLAAISTDTALLRVNGTQVASSAGDQGTGNYGTQTLALMSRADGLSNFFTGRIYFWLIRSGVTSGGRLVNLERYAARKAGITL